MCDFVISKLQKARENMWNNTQFFKEKYYSGLGSRITKPWMNCLGILDGFEDVKNYYFIKWLENTSQGLQESCLCLFYEITCYLLLLILPMYCSFTYVHTDTQTHTYMPTHMHVYTQTHTCVSFAAFCHLYCSALQSFPSNACFLEDPLFFYFCYFVSITN